MLFLRGNLQASSKYVEVISAFFQLSFLKMVWFLWFYRASSLWFWWVTWCLSLWTVFVFLNRKVVYFWPMFHLIVIYHYNCNHFSILFVFSSFIHVIFRSGKPDNFANSLWYIFCIIKSEFSFLLLFPLWGVIFWYYLRLLVDSLQVIFLLLCFMSLFFSFQF